MTKTQIQNVNFHTHVSYSFILTTIAAATEATLLRPQGSRSKWVASGAVLSVAWEHEIDVMRQQVTYAQVNPRTSHNCS